MVRHETKQKQNSNKRKTMNVFSIATVLFSMQNSILTRLTKQLKQLSIGNKINFFCQLIMIDFQHSSSLLCWHVNNSGQKK
jgi:hypothetical protein